MPDGVGQGRNLMLDLGWTEIMLIVGVAVMVISPKDLPRAMRQVGNWVGEIRRMARGFRSQLNEAIRETELEDVTKDMTSIGNIDPLAETRKDLNKISSDINRSMSTDPAPAAASETPAVIEKPADTVSETPKLPEAAAPEAATAEPVTAEPVASDGKASS